MAKTSGDPSVRASGPDGRAARAERAAAVRAERERKARRARTRNLAVIIAVVVIAGAVAAVLAQRGSGASASSADAPPGLSAGQGYQVGTGPVHITIYEDFQCPACQALEQSSNADLTALAKQGKATVEYIPVSILDRLSSGTEYSSRAANAAYCAPANRFKAFHDKLYANQPAEGGTGLTDDKIVALAKEAGISDPGFATCVKNRTYDSFVTAQTTSFSNALQKRGQDVATPGVLVNGKTIGQEWQQAGFFSAIVAQESSGSPSPSPSAG